MMFSERSAQFKLDVGVTRRRVTRMAFEGMLSKMGSGMKQLTDRYADYSPPVSDPHLLYAYEPAIPTHETVSKHHYGGGGGHKNNAAMSALTLLAFLFFLHILQQCIKEHIVAMSTPQITIMTAGREGEEAVKKSEAKLDKSGIATESNSGDKENNFEEDTKYLTKLNTAKPPKTSSTGQYIHGNAEDRRVSFPGFVSAMTDTLD